MLSRPATLALLFLCGTVSAQTDSTAALQADTAAADTLSKFDSFNKKAEKFFKYCPVPLISYSTEAGNVFGLAKFNAFKLYKNDTITKPSRVSGVFTASTKGRINFSAATDLVFRENKNIILSYINYRKQPEFIVGITNEINLDSLEEVTVERFKWYVGELHMVAPATYVGGNFDLSSYYNIEVDTNGVLRDALGLEGGQSIGLGVLVAHDSRDNRYNAAKGAMVMSGYTFYTQALGSTFTYGRFDLDARYYRRPWPKLKHVLAVQLAGTILSGDVPFYDLGMLGGDSRMRGYYLGAIRDKVLVDAQVEYRLPIWNIFGMVAWVGAGRTAPSVEQLSIDGFHPTYGLGARLRVDSGSNINLRVDFGFGQPALNGFYINFSEAF